VSEVTVSIDNRVRLVAAVLAAGRWPDHEQQLEPHAVHTHAKMTRQYVSDFSSHPAVSTLNELLESEQLVLTDLFSAVLRCSWPLLEPLEPLPPVYQDGVFVDQLADFYTNSAVAAFFWSDHKAVWEEAAQDLQNIFQNKSLPSFLDKLIGRPLPQAVTVIPNLVYPSLQPIAAPTQNTLYLILPPPRAFGESPPWPYHEDPGWILAQSCYALTEVLLAGPLSELDGTQQKLLRHAAVTLCLEETLNQQESLSYLVRSKKQYNLPDLPAAVEKLKTHLQNPGGGSLSNLF
jgi:hypothetical protein